MKLVGCLLLMSGWLIVLSALVMLTSLPLRSAFVGAGISVEALGLVLLIRGYLPQRGRQP